MSDFDTILRCLGYSIEFLQFIAVPLLLMALTVRLAR